MSFALSPHLVRIQALAKSLTQGNRSILWQALQGYSTDIVQHRKRMVIPFARTSREFHDVPERLKRSLRSVISGVTDLRMGKLACQSEFFNTPPRSVLHREAEKSGDATMLVVTLYQRTCAHDARTD